MQSWVGRMFIYGHWIDGHPRQADSSRRGTYPRHDEGGRIVGPTGRWPRRPSASWKLNWPSWVKNWKPRSGPSQSREAKRRYGQRNQEDQSSAVGSENPAEEETRQKLALSSQRLQADSEHESLLKQLEDEKDRLILLFFCLVASCPCTNQCSSPCRSAASCRDWVPRKRVQSKSVQ